MVILLMVDFTLFIIAGIMNGYVVSDCEGSFSFPGRDLNAIMTAHCDILVLFTGLTAKVTYITFVFLSTTLALLGKSWIKSLIIALLASLTFFTYIFLLVSR